ncbi:Phage tail fiber protein [Moraxella catarrhalis]|nr:Phage tail fiber protein [Moraxella catarrhalis]
MSGNTSSINTLNQSLTTKERALTTKQEQLTAELANKASTASVNSLSQSLASKERALSIRINTVESSMSGNTSSINTLNQTLTTKERALSERINTVQTTLNGQTASIQQHAQSLNGLSAQWTLKVQSGGIVSGIGLASNNGVSDFAIRADKLYVASPQGDKTPMFSTVTRTTTINGVTVPPGNYLSDAHIGNGSITNAKIANAAIDSVKIANAAITSAKIQDGQIVNAKIANGAITTAKIGNAQVDTLQIAGEAVIVPRAQTLVGQSGVGWQGDAFDLTINTAGSAVVVNAVFSVDVWKDVYSKQKRGGNSTTMRAEVDSEVRIDLFCNGSLITQGVCKFRNYAEKHHDPTHGAGDVTARDDKTVGIYNFMHVSPPHNARYQTKLSVTHRSRDTHHKVYQGSILVMAVKR